MSKTRDEMAEKYVDDVLATPGFSIPVGHRFQKRMMPVPYLQEVAYQAGWDSALKNAPEVLALVAVLSSLERHGHAFKAKSLACPYTSYTNGGFDVWDDTLRVVTEALTQYRESVKGEK